MQDQWMRDGKGFLLVYNITARNTFDEVSALYDKILRSKDQEKVPMYVVYHHHHHFQNRHLHHCMIPSSRHISCSVLVGNKCDLVNERDVETAEGEELGMKGSCLVMVMAMAMAEDVWN